MDPDTKKLARKRKTEIIKLKVTPSFTKVYRLECLTKAWEIGIQSLIKSYQRFKRWSLILPSLTLSIIRYGSRVNWSYPGNEVASFHTPRYCSYWKGSLWSQTLLIYRRGKVEKNKIIKNLIIYFEIVVKNFVDNNLLQDFKFIKKLLK